MNGLYISLYLLTASIALSFLYGLITKNHSTVDRLWSLLPGVYVLCWMPEQAGLRYWIPSILVILWCIRLTTNFAIKGGYRFKWGKGFLEEDYRWPVLKEKIGNPVLFQLFNLFFISIFQLVLIFCFTLPIYFYSRITAEVGPWEFILFVLHLAFLLLETLADIQQLRFYRRRNSAPWKDDPRYQLGFNTFGLWRFSRHPNYFCEISQWVVVSLYLVMASGGLHWSASGAMVLILLFIGSTGFAETISSSKYARYKEWQRVTPVWFPLPEILWKGNKQREFISQL